MQGALNTAFPGISYLQVDSVGAKVSGELVWAGVLAVVTAIAAILFYIWLRFEWQFSVAAVAALVHDVTLTIGVFCLLQIEFNLSIIAAILTIVGYSLNDTVIVFDRVRENLRKFKKTPLVDVLNLSINETLSRTVMTSGTTLIALFALYFLGGDVIRGFTFAMIWGIVVGTYSSIYIASALLLRMGVNRETTPARAAPRGRSSPTSTPEAGSGGCASPRSTSRAARRSTPMGPGSFESAAWCCTDRSPCCRADRGSGSGCPKWRRFWNNAPASTFCSWAWARKSAPCGGTCANSWKRGGIGVEIMGTPAACRTYNVLLAEGRRIAAGSDPALTPENVPCPGPRVAGAGFMEQQRAR